MIATIEGDTVLDRPTAGWAGGYVAALVLASTGLFLAALVLALLFSGNWGPGLILLVLPVWMLGLTANVWRDCEAKRLWRVRIAPGELVMDLPSGRSLMAHQARVRLALDVKDVAALETRLEAFRSFGMANMQRNYGLRLTNGELIVLGEDRALATGMAEETMGQMVDTIVQKTGLPLVDLGMVEGHGGLFGLLFTSVPRWDTASMSVERMRALWQKTAMTGGLATVVIIAGLILSVMF
ncbi:MAG: hypothetical protein V7651_12270 [Hyphomonas oceanitis]|uniref:Uncharacterized protein n=1 Tax=Hyphomonas oceanitis SCH89 TaxID=1280953 RepID=A0A059G560_9PROT|nr:hypothetical protein [Hyphomonas oceanitis]KDA01931.1 hypothetical protein HOC_12777 [Hyphomonas oceanitis SCH89]